MLTASASATLKHNRKRKREIISVNQFNSFRISRSRGRETEGIGSRNQRPMLKPQCFDIWGRKTRKRNDYLGVEADSPEGIVDDGKSEFKILHDSIDPAVVQDGER